MNTRTRLAAIPLALGIALGTWTAAPAAADVPTRIITNMPVGWGKDQAYRYRSDTVRLLDAMPPGSTYRFAQYLVNTDGWVPAVIRAHKRGVNVRIALDAHAAGSGKKQVDQLRAAIGTNRKSRSFVHLVRGSGLSHAPTANLHVKLQQFSNTLTTSLGSQNMSDYNMADSTNETQWWTNQTIYDAGRRYFNQIAADTGKGYRYHTTSVDKGRLKIHWYPKGPDHVAAALAKVKTGPDCLVQISMFQWSDSSAPLHKARQLDSLARRGCRVQVAWNYVASRKLIGVKSGRVLLSSRKIGVRNVRVAGKIHTHDKLTVIRYRTGGRLVTLTISGSGNFIDNRRVNGDAVVENSSAYAFSAYSGHFNQLWATGRPGVQPIYGPGAASVDEDDAETFDNSVR